MLQEGEDQSEVVVEQSYRSMLNVVDGSKNFGADNDLKGEATQLGNWAAGQPYSWNNLLRIVDRQKSAYKA